MTHSSGAFITCAGPFLRAESVIHRLDDDLRTAPSRPRDGTFATPGLPNRANTHARCNEGLLMMSVEDAAPFDSLFRCNHHVRWSISACEPSDPPPQRWPSHWNFSGIFFAVHLIFACKSNLNALVLVSLLT